MANQDATVFDRRGLRLRRARAAGGLSRHDFLLREVADRLVDRLLDIRQGFALGLDLGCHTGQLAAALLGEDKVQRLVQADLEPAMVRQAAGLRLAADEERLPFADDAFDVVVSNLSLHWVNDLPGTLVQIRRALRADGLFIAALLGGESLRELRDSLLQAEIALTGGASPRVSPMVTLEQAAGLLQRAGFALPVADCDRLTLSYPTPLALLRELRGLGETNVLQARSRHGSTRRLFADATQLYLAQHGDAEDRVPATFDVLFLTGWAPHASQPRPLRPGSAEARLASALGTEEHGAGDKARPR